MGGFGSFYKGEKKKVKKEILEKRASHLSKVYSATQVEIIGKGKGKR